MYTECMMHFHCTLIDESSSQRLFLKLYFIALHTNSVPKRSPFTQITIINTTHFPSQAFPISSNKWRQMTFILDPDDIVPLGTGLLTHSGEHLICTSKVENKAQSKSFSPVPKTLNTHRQPQWTERWLHNMVVEVRHTCMKQPMNKSLHI